MSRKTIKSLFDRDNLLNINNNFTELYQMIVNINIDTSGEIDDKLSKIKDEVKEYSNELNQKNVINSLINLNYNIGEDLLNKPPKGVDYYTYAKEIEDNYFGGIISPTSTSNGSKVIVDADSWFFYRIKTNEFTKTTFTALAKVIKSGTTSKINYRFIAPDKVTGAATDFKLLNDEEKIYGVIGIPIEKGKDLEIRFDNRGNSEKMIIDFPIVFEGEKIKKSDNELRNLNSLMKSFKTEENSNSINFDSRPVQTSYSIPVKTPDNFAIKNHPLKDKIMTDGKGHFSVNYDVTLNKLKGGKTYYIDYINGNDNNDGLSKEKAFKSVRVAIDLCKDNDTLFLCEGNHYRSGGILFSKDFNKSINVIGENNNVNIVMGDEPEWVKTSGQDKVYELTRSATRKVVDLKNNYGLSKVNSIEEVNTTLNSWYTNGTKVYINVGVAPNKNIVPLIGASNIQVSKIPSDMYFENLNVYGGNNPIQLNLSKGNKAYFKNVNFYHSNPGFNGVAITGGDLVVFDNCKANYNDMDGFNHHIGADSSLPLIIEINCIGIENGSDKGTAGFKSNNGTTTHDGVKSIRINGSYGRNDGGNVADVNTGTQSWNLGCAAFESYQGKDFQTSSGGTMFLDNCIAYGSENSINVVDDTATTYIRMGEYQNKLITGKEVKY